MSIEPSSNADADKNGNDSNGPCPSIRTKLITGLWIGDSLPPLARLCVRSFQDHGFTFRLFAYSRPAGVPETTEVHDAREILPESELFVHSTGSLAPTADRLRYRYLAEHGGLWTDMDVACLRPFEVPIQPFFTLQEPGVANLSVLQFPSHHDVMVALESQMADPANPMPWDTAAEVTRKKLWMDSTTDALARRPQAEWSLGGPEGFTKALKHFGLFDLAAREDTFNPVPYTCWRWNFDGTYSLGDSRFDHSLAIHLWGDLLRREPDALEFISPTSVIGELMKRHGCWSNPSAPRPSSRESSKKPSILVGICSCRKYTEKRSAVRETWLTQPVKNIACRFFVGGENDMPDEADTVVLRVDDTYNYLPLKVIEFFKYALANFDFDWLFKCDDDTYLALERLHALIPEEGEIVGNEALAARGSPSGGAGYLLSRHIVERLVADPTLPDTGAEDVIIGEAAVRHGAIPVTDSRLRWCASPHPRKDNGIITSHWCSPERLRAIHTSWSKQPTSIIQATHKEWSDQIEFYENSVFCRKSSGCNGIWKQNSDSTITLRWYDWNEELLIQKDSQLGRVVQPGTPLTAGKFHGRSIAVWVTYADNGLPHLGKFLARNPEIAIHVIHGKALDGPARTHAWRNCDRMIRDWWREHGSSLEFDRVIFLEWDVLFDARIDDAFPAGDFIGRDIMIPGQSEWTWFSEIDALPPEFRPHARGVAPLAVLAISRKCLSQMMSHASAEKLFEMDIFCELRLPTLAAYCGFIPIQNKDRMPNVRCHPVSADTEGGVWHSIKG